MNLERYETGGVRQCRKGVIGLSTDMLLVASHIKPWSASSSADKTNPRNLNALHDKAFDRGLLTITDKYKIRVSSDIKDAFEGKVVEQFFW
jgi:putative restriction endonuclease